MMNERAVVCLSMLCVVLVACVEVPTTSVQTSTDGDGAYGRSVASAPDHRRPTIDEVWATMARRDIPGFAGHYINTQGRSVVLVANRSSGPQARDYVRQYRRSRNLPEATVTTRVVDYDFDQLARWKSQARTALRAPTLVSIDANEAENRIDVQVSHAADTAAIRTTLLQRGIPEPASHLSYGSPAVPNRFLTQEWDPIRGGIRIRADDRTPCTMGFTGRSGSESDDRPVFYTNSHCSTVPFSDGGDRRTMFQPTEFGGDAIAYELEDVALTIVEYWWGTFRFRDSDASMYRVTDPEALTFAGPIGTIVRTTDRSQHSRGSTAQDPADPYFYVISKESVPMGARVNKVGKETGWTYGYIKETCTDQLWDYDGLLVWIDCMHGSDYYADFGDSGAPVFRLTNLSENYARAVGMHVGRNHAHTRSFFSPIAQIENDLGPMRICFKVNCAPWLEPL